ncbi:putative membrane protein [Pseudomonas chlororaphis subsp. aureofaciens]|uniref:Membrane protein n=1 Tax=Pseudomonas chlororaphis subsp. aureofaciens TaxID=587851 RepID=A0AAD0ZGB0_9PSED|nr:MAPEG family protein [Pseudomonas chlororaphis]AIC18877.1 membrane protein [Pseudomonas chlororaphis]AZE22199.1 putative membrane protein [Pseudomonas chlororaphis subsp. aureofaciens]AZE28554.1 putative membrane protein [Pseudomonas chlororaphis subsp. aureofaciens]AZE34799.1 putative membrane protein [Pseudomonas chlororaphis subsp. aureofaciens]AZE41133.1 putative membrane protein [Pseudomonas chlororaphis subsp. aureofaciens]
MSIAFWCVFISALLIYVARMPVARAMKEQGGYDNHLPRQQQAQLTGFGARALAAHQNSFEAFMLFAVGVLMAHTTQTQGWLVDGLAIVFVITRVIYLLCYWADLAWQRSLVWFIGLLCSMLLMLSPIFRRLLA